jgi:thiamine biosynthesis lipoprotein
MRLPLADPQFWIVTGGAALALGYAAWRIRRRLRAESDVPCDRCPKPGNPLGPVAGTPRGPRRLDVLIVALLAGAARLPAATVERQVAAMGTTLRVEVEAAGGRDEALAIAEAMIREVEATEARLSTWRESSELARLNRAPVGEWIESAAAPELAAAARCARETSFAFHPSIGRLVAVWGLRGTGRVPTPAELASARRGLEELGFETGTEPTRARRTADVVLEEGAFGKGAGLDAALDSLPKLPSKEEAGFVRIDLGGQVAWANAAHSVGVALADPRSRARPVLELALHERRASLASSGNSEKQFTFDGEFFGHLIDARTAAPARDFGSVAVVATSALAADCLSTALFVMGPDAGARWLGQNAGAAEAVFLVVEDRRLRARMTPRLARGARPLVPELEIEVLEGSSGS